MVGPARPGEHLGRADDHGVVRVVQGVAPCLVADDEQALGDGCLAHLVQHLRRRGRSGDLVGHGEHQRLWHLARLPGPAYGFQQRERVRNPAALHRHRHRVHRPAQQPRLLRVPGSARVREQHAAGRPRAYAAVPTCGDCACGGAARCGQHREKEQGGAGRDGDLRGVGGQAAPEPVTARGFAYGGRGGGGERAHVRFPSHVLVRAPHPSPPPPLIGQPFLRTPWQTAVTPAAPTRAVRRRKHLAMGALTTHRGLPRRGGRIRRLEVGGVHIPERSCSDGKTQGYSACMAHETAVYTHGHHESVLRSHRWRTAENSAAYLLAPPAARA